MSRLATGALGDVGGEVLDGSGWALLVVWPTGTACDVRLVVATDRSVRFGRDSFAAMNSRDNQLDLLTDTRDELTRLEHVILEQLNRTLDERDGVPVPAFILYGRVREQIDVSRGAFQAAFERLVEVGKAGLS